MDDKKSSARFPLPVRILAVALAVLVTGGALTYLIWMILNLIH